MYSAANCDSLPKLCRLQRINNSLLSGVFCSELAIRCRSGVVCSKSLPKLSWLQRNCDSLPKLSCLLRVSICCWNCGASSETAFAAELAAYSETVVSAELGSLQRTSSRCRSGLPTANQFSLPISTISLLGINDLNASNNFIVWWCKMWNTWMWTYELLK